MSAEHGGLLQDTHFWVALATGIFVVIAYVKGRKPLIAMLDARTLRIKAELEEAEALRIQAQELLAECQKKHRDALQTSQKIIDNAKETAERMQKDAEKKLEETIKRKETQLMDRIARAESAAVTELRNKAADIAARTAEIMMAEAITKRGAKMIDEAIAEIPSKLN